LPLIANRTPEWTLLCIAMLVTALIFGLYPLMSSAWTMGICSVLLGFALGIVQPMVMSLLHQLTPDTRHGEALGLRMMVINASSVVMPVLFGTAGAVIGIAGVFWFAGAAVGSGARAAWRLRESLPLVSHSK
jgi:MFS family permease